MEPTNFDIVKSTAGDLKDITADIVEAGLDQFFDNEFLKDIPILGNVLKFVGIGKKVSDAFYLKKVVKFLFQLKDVPENEREQFFTKLGNGKDKKKLDETLNVFLSRFEDVRKAELLGNLYKAYIQQKVDLDNFFKLAWCVDKAYIEDLIKLASGRYLESEIEENLVQVGFYKVITQMDERDAYFLGDDSNRKPKIEIRIQITELGSLFRKILAPEDKEIEYDGPVVFEPFF